MESSRALLYCAGGGIGDSLVASVVARALRARFAVVDALTLPSHAEVLQRVPDVDDVLVDAGESERELGRRLSSGGYGACVVTWATPRTARVAQLAAIPVRVGQARRIYSFRFTVRVVVRSEDGDVTSHWSDILLDYARAIGCDAADRAYRFVPTAGDEAQARALAGAAQRYVLLNPCNAVASRRTWPVEGWAALARALRARTGCRVFVSGSAADAGTVERVVARAADSEIVSIAGRTTVGEFGALARGAGLFVGITTGSMHVAAAVGCPTVGIFPFQSDYPDRWAPLGPRTAIVRASYPCHRGDTKERCRDYACIAHLDLERIAATAESLLAC